jgi:hypothetical protein
VDEKHRKSTLKPKELGFSLNEHCFLMFPFPRPDCFIKRSNSARLPAFFEVFIQKTEELCMVSSNETLIEVKNVEIQQQC